jgi:hypothetical protein
MTDIPLFIDEVKQAFATLLEDRNFDRHGKYCLIIDDVSSSEFDCEKIASAFLLTNALLMTRAKSKIIKLVCLNPAPGAEIHSVVNVLRSMFTSDFSSLGNVNLWVEVLERDFKLPSAVLGEIENTVRFMEDSEIGHAESGFGKAEVFIGVSNTPSGDVSGGQFNLTSDNLFHFQLSSLGIQRDMTFNEVFMGTHNIYRTGNQGLNNFVQISQTDMSSCIAEWMLEIDPFLDREFYKST